MILEVVRSTRRSTKIQGICKEFLQSKSITHFAAIHWRYDLKDYLHFHTGGEQVNKIKSIRADPTKFAQEVFKQMTKVGAKTILLFRIEIKNYFDKL